MESDTIRDMEYKVLELIKKQINITKKARNISETVKGNPEKNEGYEILIDDIKELGEVIRELEIEISFEKRQFKREANQTESIKGIQTALESIATGVKAVVLRSG